MSETILSLNKQTRPDAKTVGDFNSSLSPTERILKQKIEKNILELNNTLRKMDIIDIFTTSDHLSILEHEIIHFSQQPMQLSLK
jgi:hypothetical protein